MLSLSVAPLNQGSCDGAIWGRDQRESKHCQQGCGHKSMVGVKLGGRSVWNRCGHCSGTSRNIILHKQNYTHVDIHRPMIFIP